MKNLSGFGKYLEIHAKYIVNAIAEISARFPIFSDILIVFE